MSQIIRYLKCDKCNKEYNDLYISFGHPEKDINWKWKCDECREINTQIIRSMSSCCDCESIKIKDEIWNG